MESTRANATSSPKWIQLCTSIRIGIPEPCLNWIQNGQHFVRLVDSSIARMPRTENDERIEEALIPMLKRNASMHGFFIPLKYWAQRVNQKLDMAMEDGALKKTMLESKCNILNRELDACDEDRAKYSHSPDQA
ncbi:hypothetical protein SEMRO_1407_G269970.1 [Seminavis robusta]|uniref:Uncharacterized protein n=1 Tax=Seminavis robusta TaxID=568900 RepID=A0A9N8EN41_9STRA|nr:hypothetical protein SEMRO_1407_G269970.1 [Seminavis robusta]|eukprot:Sro1407_g269970.1 n/a (134) ;mRNA; r:845-1246